MLVQSKPDGDALHLRRGIAMPPTPLDGKPLAGRLDRPTGARTSPTGSPPPDNPYFAKALVNRVWRNFMGRGLVEAEDDLRETNPPSNRELFDALAADFVKNKYDVKHLMRMILNSAAYQRSSKPLKENAADDRFYSRYLLRRLPAEVILDAYSDITGVPTPFDKITSAGRRRDHADRDLSRRHARGAVARLAHDVAVPRRVRPRRARADVFVRAHRRRERDAGAAPEQRPHAQRQTARQELRGR